MKKGALKEISERSAEFRTENSYTQKYTSLLPAVACKLTANSRLSDWLWQVNTNKRTFIVPQEISLELKVLNTAAHKKTYMTDLVTGPKSKQ